MVLDGLGVALARVAKAPADAPEQAFFRLGRFGQPVRHRQDFGQGPVHVDQAFHIGLAQRVQTGVDQQRQGRRIAHEDLHLRLHEVAQRQRRTPGVSPAQTHR
ncbi:hypothetical protein D9M68_820680 [compost metagenome]